MEGLTHGADSEDTVAIRRCGDLLPGAVAAVARRAVARCGFCSVGMQPLRPCGESLLERLVALLHARLLALRRLLHAALHCGKLLFQHCCLRFRLLQVWSESLSHLQ